MAITLTYFAPQFSWTDTMIFALRDGVVQGANGPRSQVAIVDSNGAKVIFKGSFTVDAPVIAGTITSFEVWDGDDKLVTAAFTHTVEVEDAGAAGGDNPTLDDLIEALLVMFGNEPVTTTGSRADEPIFGGLGDDTLSAGKGNDLLTGFSGDDQLNGGQGRDDEVRYDREHGPQNVIVNFGSTEKIVGAETVAAGHARDSFGDTDTLSGIEFASGTEFGDYFFGSDQHLGFPLIVSGGAGNDHYEAGGSDFGVEYDVLEVENGGYLNVIINLTGTTQEGLAARTGRDTYGDIDSFTGITWIGGSYGKDTILGGSASETLLGAGGNDVIKSGGGTDVVEGGEGKDKLEGGAGRDTVSGGANRDSLTGGAAADRFQYFDVVESKGVARQRDFITDFKHGVDEIDLLSIDANTTEDGNQKFVLDARGSAGTSVAKGHIGWYQVNKPGGDDDRTIIKINVDNSHKIEMSIELDGLVNLTKGDFIL